MITPIESTTFIELSSRVTIVDVRAPLEFAQGHIPGAVNIPLFDDTGRAQIGTVYKQQGQDAAVELGYTLANPMQDSYLSQLQQVAPDGSCLLHCWRGGMRSKEMAGLFSKAGYNVYLLIGGYKAYRRHIREELSKPCKVVVLGGMTGSGKTMLLGEVARLGEQVIDIEHLAAHKGSVFGALGQPPQPTNEQFENNLYAAWYKLDASRPVWLEDESRMIGKVTLPDPLIHHINTGLLITIEHNREGRIDRLVEEYAGFSKEELGAAVMKISERLGGQRTQEALAALGTEDYRRVADITLAYYDKAYTHAIERRSGLRITHQLMSQDAESTARKIIKLAYNTLSNGTSLS